MESGSEVNPYQAPGAESDEVFSEAPTGPSDYRDQSTLVAILTLALGALAGMMAFNVIACTLLAQSASVSEPGSTSDFLVTWSGRLATASAVLTFCIYVPFAVFLYRSNKNARALSGVNLPFTPASMIWWFAVPILNWFRPYSAVKCVWEASAPTEPNLASATSGSILGWWWGAWLLNNIGQRGIDAILRATEDVAFHNVVAATAALIAGASAGTAALFVRALHARQQARAAEPA